MRHLARTHDRYGRDAREAARCDMIYEGIDEVRLEVRRVVTTEPAKRAAFREELARAILPLWLARFERLLAANGDGAGFLVGDGCTFPDVAFFLLFENLRDNGFGPVYTSFPRLAAHAERMAARPGLASYLVSVNRFPIQLLPT